MKCDFCEKEMSEEKYSTIDLNLIHDNENPDHYRICRECYDKVDKMIGGGK